MASYFYVACHWCYNYVTGVTTMSLVLHGIYIHLELRKYNIEIPNRHLFGGTYDTFTHMYLLALINFPIGSCMSWNVLYFKKKFISCQICSRCTDTKYDLTNDYTNF